MVEAVVDKVTDTNDGTRDTRESEADHARMLDETLQHGITTDFGVLDDDRKVKVVVYTAPNPLRAAEPGRLERFRADLRGIIAARRASKDFVDG